jgi:hypothetical protein
MKDKIRVFAVGNSGTVKRRIAAAEQVTSSTFWKVFLEKSCNLPTFIECNTFILKLKFESVELSAVPATMR